MSPKKWVHLPFTQNLNKHLSSHFKTGFYENLDWITHKNQFDFFFSRNFRFCLTSKSKQFFFLRGKSKKENYKRENQKWPILHKIIIEDFTCWGCIAPTYESRGKEIHKFKINKEQMITLILDFTPRCHFSLWFKINYKIVLKCLHLLSI